MHHSDEKLALIRASMKESGLDAYIIPDTDPHLNEYIPDHWRIISWLTGFTGSAATVVVTQCFAGLWTDSRYFIQAEDQLLHSAFILMKPSHSDTSGFIGWLKENLERGSRIGLDGRTFSISRLRRLRQACTEKNITVDIEFDTIPEIWTGRPSLPGLPAMDYPVKFAGKDRAAKILEVRDEMARLDAEYHLLASPDDIMWLLNIRGKDIKYSPLLLSFAIVGKDQILLFTDEDKIPDLLAREFDKLGIIILPYEEISGMISTLRTTSSLLISPATTSAALYNSIYQGIKIKEDISIPARLKAVKNSIEIRNIGNAMIRDGVALTRFFYWIDRNSGSVPMSELSLTEKLYYFRSRQDNFLGLSFSSIVAYNEHAALPHYNAVSETDSIIGQEGLLLVDSGSQYLDGTTDITRTIAMGQPSEKQKNDFTRVLKGNISLAMSQFPAGTFGYQLDTLARKNLWEHGLNYGHGTGHGVGYCLNVHEGPYGISPMSGIDRNYPIVPGVLISDEPGIYRKDEYGIRIENLLICYEHEETEFGHFLKFDTVSLCYIDKNLINKSLLDRKETEWLNKYHAEVYDKISPHLSVDEKNWLLEKTEEI